MIIERNEFVQEGVSRVYNVAVTAFLRSNSGHADKEVTFAWQFSLDTQDKDLIGLIVLEKLLKVCANFFVGFRVIPKQITAVIGQPVDDQGWN